MGQKKIKKFKLALDIQFKSIKQILCLIKRGYHFLYASQE